MSIRIKQAIIPAAGLGTRFLPVTKIIPKELLPILERPALEYVVQELAESGIEEIILVLSPEKEAVFEYFSEGGFIDQMLEERGHGDKLLELNSLLKRIKFKRVYQKLPLGLGHAVACAQKEIKDPFFAVVLPDDMILSQTPALSQLIDEHNSTGQSIIGIERVDQSLVHSYGIVGTYESMTPTQKSFLINTIIEKPEIQNAPSNMAVVGRYILPQSIFKYLEETLPGKQGEIQLTSALEKIVAEQNARGLIFEGIRIDVGQPLGFVKANILYGKQHKKFGDQIKQMVLQITE